MLSTVSKASGEASASGMVMSYFRSRNRFNDTIENESTMPPVISSVWNVISWSSSSSRYSLMT